MVARFTVARLRFSEKFSVKPGAAAREHLTNPTRRRAWSGDWGQDRGDQFQQQGRPGDARLRLMEVQGPELVRAFDNADDSVDRSVASKLHWVAPLRRGPALSLKRKATYLALEFTNDRTRVSPTD